MSKREPGRLNGQRPGSWRLGPIDQIPVGEGRAFAIGNEQVAVFRPRGGRLQALQAICPHRGGPLADGLIDDAQVVCPLHNHAFRLVDGQCTTGEWTIAAYHVAMEDGEVVVRL
jgi:NAD(P)H-dependent nitrite reductase small subunit